MHSSSFTKALTLLEIKLAFTFLETYANERVQENQIDSRSIGKVSPEISKVWTHVLQKMKVKGGSWRSYQAI